MNSGRVEPYHRALTELRERLRTGAWPAGARITAKDVAEALKLSPTPVREAMARLAGEGLLVERRGDGFFVRTLSAAEITDLHRLSRALFAETRGGPPRPRPDLAQALAEPATAEPVRTVERLLLAWIMEAHSPIFTESYRQIVYQLGAVRRQEHRLIPDLADEAAGLVSLADAAPSAQAAAVEAFHARRIALADALAELVIEPREFDATEYIKI